MTTHRLVLFAIASTALLSVTSPRRAQAQPKPLKAKVVSVRANRVYLQLEEEANLAQGQEIVVARGGKSAKVRLVASSSKFLLISRPKKLALEADQTVTVQAKAEAPATPLVKAGPARRIGGSISIGRRAPTLQQFRAQAPPRRKLFNFDGTVEEDAGEDDDDDDDDETKKGSRPANEVRGSLEVGIDGAYEDDQGNTSRTTPYASLRLEIRRLFGMDRAKLVAYATVRQPFNSRNTWATGRSRDHLRVRLTALALVFEPSHPDDIKEFSDRIVLNLGRDSVPDVVEAGVIDGAHLGIQIGPVTPFGFAGFAVSPNPRHEDYRTTIVGAGLRFNYAAEHTGSIRITVAMAQEVYKQEGDRGFAEANLDAQAGIFGLRGTLVYDIFSSLRDEERSKVTVGELSAYVQLTDHFRFAAGYSERRPVYTGALIQEDLSVLASLNALGQLPESPRINIYVEATYAVARSWELRLRAERYTSRESRDFTGGVLSVALLDLLAHDRLHLDVAVRFRDRGDRITTPGRNESETRDISTRLGYRYLGELVTWSLDLVWRHTRPKHNGEQRYGARLAAEVQATSSFALGGYAEGQIQKGGADDDVDLLLLGLYVRADF